MRYLFSCIVFFIIASGCNNSSRSSVVADNPDYAGEAILSSDSSVTDFPGMELRMQKIKNALAQKIPIILLDTIDALSADAQKIAVSDSRFQENLFDKKTGEAYRNEIFNVFSARPQEVPKGFSAAKMYRVEMYNYPLNLTTIALVDLATQKAVSVNIYPHTQPDLNSQLRNLALQIAASSAEVMKALGYQPEQKDAIMAATKTALNRTKCERSMHLCVAPTFVKGDKALWAIVDLTDQRVVGVRWTNVENAGPSPRISERKLLFEKIMECNCKKVSTVEKAGWKFNYVITSSDGLRISEVYFNNQLILNSAKLVDWHVSYSGTDGFGYSDAIGCPEFSQAAVVAVKQPMLSDLQADGKTQGFVLEQSFQSEQWPMACNYNYVQRFEFYTDGRFRIAAASLGRGCGNDGTYRPVTRISFAQNQATFSEWVNSNWQPWITEQWRLQNSQTTYTQEGYQYRISDEAGQGYYIEPGNGQFKDGGRGDNAFVYVTKLHADKDEGEADLVTIGPCCNTDYRQGPEKFIEPSPENIQKAQLVMWYVPQIKNDNTKGKEYCWAESYLENGVYKTRVYPCFSGPMFIPVNLSKATTGLKDAAK